MENAEEIFNFLEDFSKRKPKIIPQELNEYLAYVARTGDPVYQWSLVRPLFKEKLVAVLTEFYETSPGIDIPPYPNVDPFNYDSMKNALLERLDSFTSAPFTVQRICELLTNPRKLYNRVDKYMRAVEKNILVVSTREPGVQRHPEPENGEPAEPIVNGSDNNSEYNVDVEMEDMTWKENSDQHQNLEPQPGSSDTHISVDDLEARLKAKKDTPLDTQDKISVHYESVTPPELNTNNDELPTETKTSVEINPQSPISAEEQNNVEATTSSELPKEEKVDVEMKIESKPTLIIPEIRVDDADMTEQRLNEESAVEKVEENVTKIQESVITDVKPLIDSQPVSMDESSSDSTTKDDLEPKVLSEVSTSSEESSSSSDNTDGNSNSPKTDDRHIDVQEESNQSDTPSETTSEESNIKEPESTNEIILEKPVEEQVNVAIESDNYSISDVNSELPQPNDESPKTLEAEKEIEKEEGIKEPEKEEPVIEKSETIVIAENKTES